MADLKEEPSAMPDKHTRAEGCLLGEKCLPSSEGKITASEKNGRHFLSYRTVSNFLSEKMRVIFSYRSVRYVVVFCGILWTFVVKIII